MEEIAAQSWDVIVIGTGMGGATLGYALAKEGKRVLFCEKGKSACRKDSVKGHYPEEGHDPLSTPDEIFSARLAEAGRAWEKIEERAWHGGKSLIPFIGAGVGGSSALYGMALERFYPEDFAPRAHYPEEVGNTLPETWPITYADLAPYYQAAEQLYRVRGSADPLRGSAFHPPYLEPPPYSEGASKLFDFLNQHGCHPYRLPQACEYVADCHCCQGYLCPNQCKNDSGRICIEPALKAHGAVLQDECEVLRLEAGHNSVSGVICKWRGRTFTLHGDLIVLAAGALATPQILLQSASEIWPLGLANGSGLVGKNLMRHYVDLYVLPAAAHPHEYSSWKEIAFNDFYFHGKMKLGSVQGFGALPPADQLVDSLGAELHQGALPFLGYPFRLLKPLLRKYLRRLLSGSLILASLVEDLPYPDNRIALGADGRLRIHYRMRPSERKRVHKMRALLRQLLAPYRPKLIKQAENNQRLAHACGTCRFGVNSFDSVLNKDNRAHEVDNLYVVDASFFPSSAGINPGLTIAANALRVAHSIISST